MDTATPPFFFVKEAENATNSTKFKKKNSLYTKPCTNLASTLSKIYHQYFAIKVVGFVINIHSAVNMTHTKLEKQNKRQNITDTYVFIKK